MDLHVKGVAPATANTSSREFEDFIYLISHDVRNSVRALIEVPQWIAEDLQDAGIRIEGSLAENMELMNIHTRRLDRMLYDLLVYSRIGRMQNVVDVDLAEAIEILRQEIRIPPGLRVEVDLKQKTLRIGEQDIMTLLIALMSNVIRHGDAETDLVRITSRREGEEVVLTFADNGPGIPQAYRGKVFGAMTTLRPRDEVEGSGMGLAHVKKIVELYGGTISWMDLDSPRGVGFEIRLPG